MVVVQARVAMAMTVTLAAAAAAPSVSSQLPAEHRLPSDLVLPDTANIPGQLLGQWQVDKFFSLWYIFALSDNVEVSKEPYTVLAPGNAAFDRVKLEPGFSGRDRIVNVLRNHIILGEVVTGERLKQLRAGEQLRLRTLLGTLAVFTNRDGQLFVNDTAIVGDIMEITNASIVRTADYLPLPAALAATAQPEAAQSPTDGSGDAEHHDLDTSETLVSLPLLNEVGDLVELEPESPSPAVIVPAGYDFATNNQRMQIPAMGKDSFVEAVEDALSLLRSGVGEFQGYFYDANITSMFSKVNEAFQRFYPIDWGFNPFLVREFMMETIINHFVPGKITSKNVTDGLRIKTMGGKQLEFRKVPEGLMVNGHPLFLGDTPISHGNILFLDELLFVNYDMIAELRKQHRDIETAPALAGSAGDAEFLAHLIGQLTHRMGAESSATYHKFVEYLTKAFGDIMLKVPNDHKYTFLALDDAAVSAALWPAGPDRELAVDPLLADRPFRADTLLGHLVAERLYLRDLRDGTTLTTVSGHTLNVTITDGVIHMNSARLLPRQEHVYNLGNVLFVDSFPLVSEIELRRRASQPSEPEGSGHELAASSADLRGAEDLFGGGAEHNMFEYGTIWDRPGV